ncbi:MAG: WD40 repeat domain-containing protein, partial [Acidimicrobiales bacterium]
TLRADHYDDPLQVREIADLLHRGAIPVGPMSPEELEQAIVRPARAVGVEVEPALTAELVAEVSHRPSTLPLLQFALTELYTHRVSGLMLASAHETLGRLTGALAVRADRIIDAGDSEDEAAARRIFGRLVVHGGRDSRTRRRALRSEFGDDPRTLRLLDEFIEARLLASDRDPTSREATVEVAHEALLRDWPRLTPWLDQDQDDLRVVETVTTGSQSWQTSGQDLGELARGGRLQTVVELAERRPDLLNESELRWITASKDSAAAEDAEREAAAARDRAQNRRLRRLLAAASVLLVAAVAAGGIALVLRNRAIESEKATDLERLIAVSASEFDREPDRAILLALEASRRNEGIATSTAVHRSIAGDPGYLGIFPQPIADVSWTDFTADGELGVSAALSTGEVVWFDVSSGENVADVHNVGGQIRKLTMSGDGSVTAVGLPDGHLTFINTSGDEIAGRIDTGSEFGVLDIDDAGKVVLSHATDVVQAFDIASGAEILNYDPGAGFASLHAVLTPDGSVAVVALLPIEGGHDFPVDVIDVASGKLLQRIDDQIGEVRAVAASGDGRLAIGYASGSTVIHDQSGGEAPVIIGAHEDRVDTIQFSSDGRLITGGANGEIRFWGSDGIVASPSISLFGDVLHPRITPEGNLVAALIDGGHVVVDRRRTVLVDKSRVVNFVSGVSPHSQLYNTPSPDFKIVNLHRLEDGQLVRSIDLKYVTERPYFSTDGEWILTPSRSGDITVTEIDGERQHTIDIFGIFEEYYGADTDENFRFSIRPANGGERIFALGTGNFEGVRAVWINSLTKTIEKGPLALEFGGPAMLLADGRILAGDVGIPLAILPADLDSEPQLIPDGSGLAAFHQDPVSGNVLIGGSDGRVGILDVETRSIEFIEGASGVVLGGAFSPSGSRIAILTQNGDLQLIDVESRTVQGVPMSVAEGIGDTRVRWSEDGSGVWVVARSGPVRFSADPEAWRRTACSIVNRELTPSEWAAFVSASAEQVPACR